MSFYSWWLLLVQKDFSLFSVNWLSYFVGEIAYQTPKVTGLQCRTMDDFISTETNDDDDYVVVRVTEITRKPQTMVKGNWEENWRGHCRSWLDISENDLSKMFFLWKNSSFHVVTIIEFVMNIEWTWKIFCLNIRDHNKIVNPSVS